MKRVLNQRPVAFAAFFLIVGIACSYYAGLPAFFAFPATIVFAVIFIGLLFFKKKPLFLFLYLSMFFLGSFLFQGQFHTDFSTVLPNRSYEIRGYVSDRAKMNSETHTYTLTDVTFDGERFDKKVILYSPEKLDFGDTVVFESEITPPSAPRNPGDFDEQMYLAGKGAGFSSYMRNVEVVENRLSWYQYPFLLRETLAENIDHIFSAESAPIAKAMFLGVKDEIPQEVRDNFSKTGVAHVLAISGLHIAIISYALNFLLKRLRMERKLRFSLNIILLILYATLTGFAPSILRAVLMMIFVLIGRWRFGKRDTLVFLSAALIVTLLFNAAQLFSAGLLMSYGVVFGLLCLNPPLMRLLKKIRLDKAKLDVPIASSLSATVSVFPMTAYYFNSIALGAPIANLFAIPLAGVIVIFTGIGTLCSLIFLPAGQVLAFPAELSIRALTWLNGLLAQTSFGYIEMTGFPVWIGIVVMALIFLCSDYVLLGRKAKTIVAGVLVGAAVCVGIATAPTVPFQAVILDVGTGDAVHISVEGRDYLIDNGGNLQYSNIENYAEENRLTFEAVIVTNEKTKNLKGLAGERRINALYVPKNYEKKEYDTYAVKEYGLCDKIELGGSATLDVVGTDGKYRSLVLRYKGAPVCLFLQTTPDKIDFAERVPVIKPAGGGKKGAVTEELLMALRPECAVISVKQNNKKELPDRSVIELLAKHKVEVITTAEHGAVAVLADGQIKTTK